MMMSSSLELLYESSLSKILEIDVPSSIPLRSCAFVRVNRIVVLDCHLLLSSPKFHGETKLALSLPSTFVGILGMIWLNPTMYSFCGALAVLKYPLDPLPFVCKRSKDKLFAIPFNVGRDWPRE
ncbi:hypothetical protein Tco_0873508 [Tanacetum coccineum]|uniref:Uncharacterized protein n=1 Tax=Tanacetum coccineum TaxID=301880 RepID=A0ABQ5BLY6_9ASTR